MTSTGTGFTHEAPYRGATDDWLTPPTIIKALGPFDLDPCASVDQPWNTATHHLTERGLTLGWGAAFVWCNPPYGPATWKWLEKMGTHNNGIALTFARTETRGFFGQVWRGGASGLLFLEGRLTFHYPKTGKKGLGNSGAPSVLISYGELGLLRLKQSGIPGALVESWAV